MANTNADAKMKIAAWAKKVGVQMDQLASQTSQEMAQMVHAATPVDTGNLRGNWQPSVGPQMPAASNAAAKYGVSEIGAVAADMKAGTKFFFLNGTVYARRVEYGFVGTDSLGRTYNQKGRFYIRNTVKKWPQIVAKVAGELKS